MYLLRGQAMSDVVFNIRRALESDIDSAHELIEALGYPNIEQVDFKQAFAEVLHHRDSLVFIAETVDSQAIGLMTISHRPQLRLAGILVCIDELVIADSARGLGVGGALLKEAKRFATEKGAKRLELHTNRGRVSYERAFYVKNGFSETNSAVMRLEKESIKE
jgi:GNAT superfamily N-acetyltransferase